MKEQVPLLETPVSQNLTSGSWESFPTKHNSGENSGIEVHVLSTSAITLGAAAPSGAVAFWVLRSLPHATGAVGVSKLQGLTVKKPQSLFLLLT